MKKPTLLDYKKFLSAFIKRVEEIGKKHPYERDIFLVRSSGKKSAPPHSEGET